MKALRPTTAAIALAVVVTAAIPSVVRDAWATVLILAVAATALNMVSGTAGQLSIGHAALVGVGAYAAGWFATEVSPEALLTFPFAALVGACVGLLFGAPSLRLRGQYLALTTIAGGYIFVRLISDIEGLGAEQGLIDIPFMTLAGQPLSDGAHAWAAALLFCLALLVSTNVTRSHLGRRLTAVRHNEPAAEAAGIDVYRQKLTVFVVSAVMCALAGALFAHKEGFISAADFDLDLSLMLLLSCIVGGLGRPLGGPLGAVLLLGPGALLPGTQRWELAIAGGLALAVLFWMPGGIVGAVRGLRSRAGVSDLQATVPEEALSRPEPVVLRARGVSKSFGAVKALEAVDLGVEPGSIHALIGPNGSGKTTLIDLLTGFQYPDAGAIHIGDADLTGAKPHRIGLMGVARTFQRTATIDPLSVIEAASLAVRPHPGSVRSLLFGGDRSAERRSVALAMTALTEVSLRCDVEGPSDALSFGQTRRLELARAIASGPSLLICDEPSAGMDPTEIEVLAALFKRLAAKGTGVLLADHNMGFVFAVADTVTVLDHGVVIARGSVDEIRSDAEVQAAYLGKAVAR